MNTAPPRGIAPANGKPGVLLVGLGAVATTAIAGVPAIRNGLAQPTDPLLQIGTARLGERARSRSLKINEFVDLASLDNIVFGGGTRVLTTDGKGHCPGFGFEV